MLRPDLFFSYWIFVWTIITLLFTKQGVVPFYSFIIAFIFSFIIIVHSIITIKIEIDKTFIIYCLIIFIIKLLPIILIYKFYYNKIKFNKEIIIFIIIFVIYLIWKYVINKIDIVDEHKQYIKEGINIMPFYRLLKMKT